MKKICILLSITLSFLISGCSSTATKDEMFIDAAKTCNQVCLDNPSISQVSSAAGVGFSLLFMAGMETSCQCER